MKKIILTAVAVFGFAFANAQEGGFKVGAHVGLPTGDIKDFTSVNLGLDAAYTWKIDAKFDLGVTTGYSVFLGKKVNFGGGIEIKTEDSSYIPLAATAQYAIGDNFFLGADLGYAFLLDSDGDSGGFLYQPKVGYSFGKTDLFLGYKGISVDGGTYSSLNLGVAFKL